MLSEISQMEKTKYHMISFIYGIQEKKNTTEKEIRFLVTMNSGWKEGELEDWGTKGTNFWL